ncbi:hypothetical protein ACFFU2_02650 [Halomonas alkalicola]|uniref:Uncharacterized protein n=1 Tax=Halomonas alkalicola TaxID=1930622 RepID=A0ABY9H2X1_9GAMM|nr:hypothetical protein [Halomonas alkalicola]WLI72812.1 hypothetical protein B6N23_13755 [Halomonas alkalicola]
MGKSLSPLQVTRWLNVDTRQDLQETDAKTAKRGAEAPLGPLGR